MSKLDDLIRQRASERKIDGSLHSVTASRLCPPAPTSRSLPSRSGLCELPRDELCFLTCDRRVSWKGSLWWELANNDSSMYHKYLSTSLGDTVDCALALREDLIMIIWKSTSKLTTRPVPGPSLRKSSTLGPRTPTIHCSAGGHWVTTNASARRLRRWLSLTNLQTQFNLVSSER